MTRIQTLADLQYCMEIVDMYLARLPLTEDEFAPEAELRVWVNKYIYLSTHVDATLEESGNTRRSDVDEVVAQLPW